MIRLAKSEDAARIAEIHVYGWRYAYRNIISDSYLFGKLLVQKRVESFVKNIEQKIEETYVYEDNEAIKAFMTIGTCRNEDKKDSFELWGIYVEPLFKGNGIGTQLIKYCEKCAIDRGYKENMLWVFQDNKESRSFYERIGYKPDGKEAIIERFNAKEIRYSRILN